MAGRLFLLGKIKANAMLGYKTIRASFSNYKKQIIGSAAILAVLVAPFAVQAIAGNSDKSDQKDNNQSQQFQNQPSGASTESKDDKNDVKGESTSEIEVHTDMSSPSNGDGEVDVTINGQKVPVPENGHVQQTFSDGNKNQTSVDIQIDNQSSASNNSQSSTSINVDSHSYDNGSSTDECGRRAACR